MAAITPRGVLAQYPAPDGSRPESVLTFIGPASYVQISIAAPPTGGITVNASDMGLVNFDQAMVWGSDEGTYGARIIWPNQPFSPPTTLILQIFTLATGAEVAGATNLAAKTFRIWAKQGS